jgi:hypothetical protein
MLSKKIKKTLKAIAVLKIKIPNIAVVPGIISKF